jgi:hypothetical protein
MFASALFTELLRSGNPAQGSLTPAALITTDQRSTSDRTIRARCSGVLSCGFGGTDPNSSIRPVTAGSAKAAFRASVSLARTASGVPFGAKIAFQP